MTANSANISGHIVATSGSFTGEIVAGSGKIGNISIDAYGMNIDEGTSKTKLYEGELSVMQSTVAADGGIVSGGQKGFFVKTSSPENGDAVLRLINQKTLTSIGIAAQIIGKIYMHTLGTSGSGLGFGYYEGVTESMTFRDINNVTRTIRVVNGIVVQFN